MSCHSEIGTTPVRLHSPVVGRMPTTLFWVAGEMIEPSVSEPITSARQARRGGDAGAADEPPGSADESYGLRTWPLSEPLPLCWLLET